MSPTPVAGVSYAYDSVMKQWTAPGRTSLSGVAPAQDRSALVPGTYIPGIAPDTVGTLANTSFVDIEAGTDGFIRLAPGTYTNRRYWGAVTGTTSGNYIFNNCISAGMDPRQLESFNAATGAWNNYNTSRFFQLNDCTADGLLWNSVRGVVCNSRRVMKVSPFTDFGTWPYYQTASSVGVRGVNFTLRRCDISHFQDIISLTGDNWDIQDSWLHDAFWGNGWIGSSKDGKTHSDGIQFNVGKHFLFAYNLIGGSYNRDGFDIDPGGYNAGTCCPNSAIIIQQEAWGTDATKFLEDIVVHHNWFAGGAAAANIHFNGNNNPLTTLEFYSNKFLRRDTTVASHGIRNDGGYQILVNQQILDAAAQFHTNTTWDWFGDIDGTGVAATVSINPSTV